MARLCTFVLGIGCVMKPCRVTLRMRCSECPLCIFIPHQVEWWVVMVGKESTFGQMKYPRNFGAINVVTKPIEAINQKIAGCLDRPKCTVHCFRYFTVIELADAWLAVAVWPAWAGQGKLTGYFPAYCPVKQVLRHLLVVAGPPPDDRIHLGWGPADRGAPPASAGVGGRLAGS